jgi:cytochrome c oxidase assembly factor CtaG
VSVIPPAFHAVTGDEEALPRFTVGRVFTEWELISWATVLILVTTGLYLWGVLRLRQRGDRWPVGRTLSFVVVGMGSAALATVSGLAVYDDTLLSVHMVQHMVLAMVVPLAMALGAPITLALRTLPRGPRRWLLAVLHSRVARVLTFPPLTFTLFVITPWALYFSGWYAATLRSGYLHEMTHVHMVLIGCLFFWPLMGIDPIPGRMSYPARMLLVALTLPFHAFMGVTIMAQKKLLGGHWYPELHEGPIGAWLPAPHVDQKLAGGILWSSGDAVGLVFFAVLFAQWVRSSMREAEREDRRLDLLEAREARGARADVRPATPAGQEPVGVPPPSPVGATPPGEDSR